MQSFQFTALMASAERVMSHTRAEPNVCRRVSRRTSVVVEETRAPANAADVLHGRNALHLQNAGGRRSSDLMPEVLERAANPRVEPQVGFSYAIRTTSRRIFASTS